MRGYLFINRGLINTNILKIIIIIIIIIIISSIRRRCNEEILESHFNSKKHIFFQYKPINNLVKMKLGQLALKAYF